MSEEEKKIPLATELFEVESRYNRLVSDLFDFVVHDVLGLAEDDFNWPFEDITWDWYDLSFELKNCKPDFDLTPEQQKMMWEAGFFQCWLCYGNRGEEGYREKFYSETGERI